MAIGNPNQIATRPKKSIVGHLVGQRNSRLVTKMALLKRRPMNHHIRFPATRHRVVVPEQEFRRRSPRQSIVFFVHPDDQVVVLISRKPPNTQIGQDPQMILVLTFFLLLLYTIVQGVSKTEIYLFIFIF